MKLVTFLFAISCEIWVLSGKYLPTSLVMCIMQQENVVRVVGSGLLHGVDEQFLRGLDCCLVIILPVVVHYVLVCDMVSHILHNTLAVVLAVIVRRAQVGRKEPKDVAERHLVVV